jgi:GT2 family glycosyltransferase
MSAMTFVIPTKKTAKDLATRLDPNMPTLTESIRTARGHDRDQLVFVRDAASMPAALNKGIMEAVNERICFVHDDTQLREGPYWLDDILDNVFETRKVGVLGAAGSKDLFPDGRWYVQGNRMCGAVVHGQFYTEGMQMPQKVKRCEDGRYYSEWLSRYGDYGRAVVVDGVCMIAEKSMLSEIGGFDESLGSWHYYDLDLSLRAHLAGYHNIVLPLILCHYSVGSYNEEWFKIKSKFLEKWKKKLPVVLDFEEDYLVERLANLQLRQA